VIELHEHNGDFREPSTGLRSCSLLADTSLYGVRPRESTAETQPQLQPPLLRLSAMISQYFTFA